MKKLLLLILASLSSLVLCEAKTYFVATDGDDLNPGTRKAPFQTIAKASSVMQAGDECLIRGGIYREILRPMRSGEKGLPITYKNYKDEKVVIDASEQVGGWIKHSGNIYKSQTKMPEKSIYNTLFYKGEVLDIARFPNNVDNSRFSFDGHSVKGGSASHFDIPGLPQTQLVGAYFCYLGAHSGVSWTREILSQSADKIEHEGVDITQWPFNPHHPAKWGKNRGQLYVFGALDLLDHPKEWFYGDESETIYAIFPDGEAPAEGEVRMGVRRLTLDIDKDYINIDGIDCFAGEVHLSGKHCRVENGEFRDLSQSYRSLVGISAQSISCAFLVSGQDITIENNLIEGGQASGILMISPKTSRDIRVRNNVIRYFNSIGIHANPIRTNCDEVLIERNSIYTCGRDGVYSAGRNCEIAYNDIYDCIKINNDGGVFYTVGNDEKKQTKIHHNWLHDSWGPAYTDGRVAGVYLDNNSKGYDVYNNIVSNISWSALNFNWYNTDLNFYHNTIYNAGYSVGRWENGYTIERIRVINNYANIKSRDSKDWIGTEIGRNVNSATLPFIDAAANDFRPAARSGVIDAGEKIEGFTRRFKGSAPDAGALELGEKMWEVGASWAQSVKPQTISYDAERKRNDSSKATKPEDESKIFAK